ncbi:MAG: hypothetical protein NTX65_04830 [Ignavibacteriales bacterium]|nr:hypothetical protein [Ignavibacteriales bacterium]
MEGQIMDNIVLHNVKGKKYLGDLFENHDFFIAVYQNGMVCDPCLEFIQNYWAENSQKFPQGLSDKLIIIGSKNSRDTFVFLKRYNLENSYFIDINQYIQKNLLLSNILPVNFLFLIDKKLHIVYISYFTTIVKDQFKSFVSKSKKLINEKK